MYTMEALTSTIMVNGNERMDVVDEDINKAIEEVGSKYSQTNLVDIVINLNDAGGKVPSRYVMVFEKTDERKYDYTVKRCKMTSLSNCIKEFSGDHWIYVQATQIGIQDWLVIFKKKTDAYLAQELNAGY